MLHNKKSAIQNLSLRILLLLQKKILLKQNHNVSTTKNQKMTNHKVTNGKMTKRKFNFPERNTTLKELCPSRMSELQQALTVQTRRIGKKKTFSKKTDANKYF